MNISLLYPDTPIGTLVDYRETPFGTFMIMQPNEHTFYSPKGSITEQRLDQAAFRDLGKHAPVQTRWRLLFDWLYCNLGDGEFVQWSGNTSFLYVPLFHLNYGELMRGGTTNKADQEFLGLAFLSPHFSPAGGKAGEFIAEAKRLGFYPGKPKQYRDQRGVWTEKGFLEYRIAVMIEPHEQETPNADTRQ